MPSKRSSAVWLCFVPEDAARKSGGVSHSTLTPVSLRVGTWDSMVNLPHRVILGHVSLRIVTPEARHELLMAKACVLQAHTHVGRRVLLSITLVTYFLKIELLMKSMNQFTWQEA